MRVFELTMTMVCLSSLWGEMHGMDYFHPCRLILEILCTISTMYRSSSNTTLKEALRRIVNYEIVLYLDSYLLEAIHEE